MNCARIDVHGDGSYIIEPDAGCKARVIPRLRRSFNVADAAHEWICSDTSDCYSIGWGPTQEAAYEQWLSRFAHCRRGREQ